MLLLTLLAMLAADVVPDLLSPDWAYDQTLPEQYAPQAGAYPEPAYGYQPASPVTYQTYYYTYPSYPSYYPYYYPYYYRPYSPYYGYPYYRNGYPYYRPYGYGRRGFFGGGGLFFLFRHRDKDRDFHRGRRSLFDGRQSQPFDGHGTRFSDRRRELDRRLDRDTGRRGDWDRGLGRQDGRRDSSRPRAGTDVWRTQPRRTGRDAVGIRPRSRGDAGVFGRGDPRTGATLNLGRSSPSPNRGRSMTISPWRADPAGRTMVVPGSRGFGRGVAAPRSSRGSGRGAMFVPSGRSRGASAGMGGMRGGSRGGGRGSSMGASRGGGGSGGRGSRGGGGRGGR